MHLANSYCPFWLLPNVTSENCTAWKTPQCRVLRALKAPRLLQVMPCDPEDEAGCEENCCAGKHYMLPNSPHTHNFLPKTLLDSCENIPDCLTERTLRSDAATTACDDCQLEVQGETKKCECGDTFCCRGRHSMLHKCTTIDKPT